MKKILISIPLLALLPLILYSCNAAKKTPKRDYINYAWAEDKLWDDGKAEVATYEATRKVYGSIRSFEYTYIVVKELFNESFHVKSDNIQTDNTYPVMKINKFCRIETQSYPYHYLTSLFMHRGNPEGLNKLTVTSQEWCGNTSKYFLEKGGKYQFDYMSYFDGEGKGNTSVSKGPWFEDQLSYTLRTINFKEGLIFDVDIYPSQISNKVEIPRAISAHVEVVKANPEDLDGIEASYIQNPWEVKVTASSGKKSTYWIKDTYPNYLLKMESNNGSSLKLKKIQRDAYWTYE